MPTIKGNLMFVSSRAAQVSEVWVRAPQVRTHMSGVVTTGNDRFPVKDGEVNFTAVPGPAVLALISQGRAVDTIPILVGDAGTQTLRQVVSAAKVADDATQREIEKLAAEAVELVDSSVENARKAQDGATRAETAAGNAKESETNAEDAARRASNSSTSANKSSVWVSEAEQRAEKSATRAAESASAASASESNAASSANAAKSAENNVLSNVDSAVQASVQNAETAINSLVEDKTNAAWDDLNKRISQRPTLGVATSIAFGAAAALGGEPTTGGAGVAGQWDASKPITLWGDSGIDRGEPGQRMADGLKNVLRQDVVENAVGGTTLDNALLGMGGIRLWATPEGGVIPATTSPVMLNLHGADVGMMSQGKVPMTFAGVKGVFEYSNTVEGGGFVGARFTRDVAGGEVAVSSPTLLESRTLFDPYATHIIVSGGNDKRSSVKTIPEDDLRGHLVAGYVRMVEMIAASPTKHVLIGGVKGRADTEIGDWYHKLITEVNNWLKQMYPHLFVDRNRWLCEHAPRLLNIELSDEDKRRAEAWLPPKAVLQDATHTVPELRVIEGEHLWAPELAVRGWAQATKPLERSPMDITNRVPYDLQSRITDLENRLKALGA